MIASDIVLIAALAVFVLFWWLRFVPGRPLILLLAALTALVAGVYGVMNDRWQAGLGAVFGVIALIGLLIAMLRNAGRRDGVPFVSGLLYAALAACAVFLIQQFPITPLPAPGGQYAVGVRTFALADESRLGVFNAGEGQPRRLLVRVWYPAENVSGEPRPYFTRLEAQTTAQTSGQLIGFPPMFSYLRHVRTNSYENAALIAGANALPVVFYSHGYGSFLGQNTALMEHLASHGYVVFSVQHPEVSATVWPDGSVTQVDPGMLAFMAQSEAAGVPPEQAAAIGGLTPEARFGGQMQILEAARARPNHIDETAPVWLADRLFVHDTLERGGAPQNVADVVAASNFARVGEMGMSFGGSASGAICMIDRRCAAGANLDGGNFHITPFAADMPVPFLMFHSDMQMVGEAVGMGERPAPAPGFNEFSYEAFEHAGSANVTRVQLRGSRHLGFSDFSLFMARPFRDGALGTTPAPVMIGAQNDFVRGFFDRYLRGVEPNFPEAERAQYADWVLPADNGYVREWWANKPEPERAAIAARIAAAQGDLAPAAIAPASAPAAAAAVAAP